MTWDFANNAFKNTYQVAGRSLKFVLTRDSGKPIRKSRI